MYPRQWLVIFSVALHHSGFTVWLKKTLGNFILNKHSVVPVNKYTDAFVISTSVFIIFKQTEMSLYMFCVMRRCNKKILNKII